MCVSVMKSVMKKENDQGYTAMPVHDNLSRLPGGQ
jgi:hypothetical protein